MLNFQKKGEIRKTTPELLPMIAPPLGVHEIWPSDRTSTGSRDLGRVFRDVSAVTCTQHDVSSSDDIPICHSYYHVSGSNVVHPVSCMSTFRLQSSISPTPVKETGAPVSDAISARLWQIDSMVLWLWELENSYLQKDCLLLLVNLCSHDNILWTVYLPKTKWLEHHCNIHLLIKII